MKTIYTLSFALSVTIMNWLTAGCQSINDIPISWNYAVEITGVQCGYTESEITTIEKDGANLLKMKDTVVVKLSVLGGGVDMKVSNNSLIDPLTMNPVYIEHSVFTTAEMYARSEFEDHTARFTNKRNGEMKTINLEPDVIIENTVTYPHLMKDFILGTETKKSYLVFDDMQGIVATKTYKKIREEEIELAGKNFYTTVLEELNETNGITSIIWLNNENSFPLKFDIAGNRQIYLADKSVKKKIQTVNLESMLFAKVDKVIPNVPDISYMKVKTSITSGGEWITPESLNFPGQKFEGTVANNFIEGIFEIEPLRYRGENAPLFPPGFNEVGLKKYLEPESLIESDHPVVISEAKKITEGSKDSWEAAVRLSKWVAENIQGAVPGGTSAINTYNTREGECGSHSRLLAAFCRAVGIPARLSIGCMYSPYLGGSFGQHAWTEVHMGDAGWVAVDATAFEYDFVDAGHIRLGEKTSFNPKEMKILDYRIGNTENLSTDIPEQFQDYLGKYLFEERNSMFEILFQDGSLAVDIPGQTVLVLNDPDENGILYPKMTRQINLSFKKDIYGNVKKLKLQQLIPLQKKSVQNPVNDTIPEILLPMLGIYELKQAQIEFTLSYIDGWLTFDDRLSKELIKMVGPDENGRWKGESGQNEIEFEKNSEGEVSGLILYKNVFMPKQADL
ncbi:MAG: transglutaminase domain-containing protein [Prolixibacteraceae bacterium]|nr:transglutaminase domain-containing protein [Prolixibacteraceae bacterium]